LEEKLLGTRNAYGDTLARLGETHKDIVVLDADLSGSTKSGVFGKKYPSRFFNMGISEQDMIGTAAGLAAAGKRPFVSTFAIFATGKPWEQIRQTVALTNLNVKIVASHGGITVGEDGASHQCTEDIALMRVLPNMTIIVPADGIETASAVETLVHYRGPCYMRLSRMRFPVIFEEPYSFTLGKGKILQDGKDVTIIAAGLMVSQSLKALKLLKQENISARLVNMSTIKPIDREIISESAKATGAIVTAEEHSIIGGLGSAVAEVLVEEHPVPMRRIGVRDRFGVSGRPNDLLKLFNLTPGDIVQTVREVIEQKHRDSSVLSVP
jgi:transketolase